MRSGVFGGTFDPPHIGHLIAAQDAAAALALDRVLFVPAAQPPHKAGAPVTAATIRLRMLELAIAGDGRFAIDTLELARPGPSYTVDTLRELTARGGEWTLLLGADQYELFETWHEPGEIRRLARIAVLDRGGLAPRDGDAPAGSPAALPMSDGALRVTVTRIDISSSGIRRRAAAGESIRYLVPAPVEQFILEHGLYARTGPRPRGTTANHRTQG